MYLDLAIKRVIPSRYLSQFDLIISMSAGHFRQIFEEYFGGNSCVRESLFFLKVFLLVFLKFSL